MSGWTTVLVVLVTIVFTITVVVLLDRSVIGVLWRFVREEWVTNLLYAAAGACLSAAVSLGTLEEQERGWRWLWWAIGVLVFAAVAIAISWARHREEVDLEHEHREMLNQLKTEHNEQWDNFLRNHLMNLLISYGRALLPVDASSRNENARHAQYVTTMMASQLVGKTANQRTRACLYQLNETKTELRPVRRCHYGRFPVCNKVFREEHPTFKSIMNNEPVFVSGLGDDLVPDGSSHYRTFIAYPVATNTSSVTDIHGALMVDCPNGGDLDETVDVAKVAVFASLLSATYLALRNPVTEAPQKSGKQRTQLLATRLQEIRRIAGGGGPGS